MPSYEKASIKESWAKNVGLDPCGSRGLLTRGQGATDLLDDTQRLFE